MFHGEEWGYRARDRKWFHHGSSWGLISVGLGMEQWWLSGKGPIVHCSLVRSQHSALVCLVFWVLFLLLLFRLYFLFLFWFVFLISSIPYFVSSCGVAIVPVWPGEISGGFQWTLRSGGHQIRPQGLQGSMFWTSPKMGQWTNEQLAMFMAKPTFTWTWYEKPAVDTSSNVTSGFRAVLNL